MSIGAPVLAIKLFRFGTMPESAESGLSGVTHSPGTCGRWTARGGGGEHGDAGGVEEKGAGGGEEGAGGGVQARREAGVEAGCGGRKETRRDLHIAACRGGDALEDDWVVGDIAGRRRKATYGAQDEGVGSRNGFSLLDGLHRAVSHIVLIYDEFLRRDSASIMRIQWLGPGLVVERVLQRAPALHPELISDSKESHEETEENNELRNRGIEDNCEGWGKGQLRTNERTRKQETQLANHGAAGSEGAGKEVKEFKGIRTIRAEAEKENRTRQKRRTERRTGEGIHSYTPRNFGVGGNIETKTLEERRMSRRSNRLTESGIWSRLNWIEVQKWG
ncbi:hypothetical protein B0H14DRAFT_3164157 [Mycena olivaceomarginata]|nr:hypothetical protein B0H14DRAFT_3164157 [Mycena olivaceomarginata]